MEPPRDATDDAMAAILEQSRREFDEALAPFRERMERDAETMRQMLEEDRARCEPVWAEMARRDAELTATLEKLGVSVVRPHRGYSRGPDAIPGRAFDIVKDGDDTDTTPAE